MSRQKSTQRSIPLWLTLTLLLIVLIAHFMMPKDEAASAPVEGELAVHFIDVGQGDSALLCTSDATILIDAGPSSARTALLAYLKTHVEKIDMMILTHPHEDHIGSAAQVIGEIPVTRIVMPDAVSTSMTFERLLDAIEQKGINAEIATAGAKYEFGDLRIEVLAPLSEHEDLNNASIVCRADFGTRSFLFTGDAEDEVEKELLSGSARLSADVLKVGHHGSNSSSTAKFLAAVKPGYAIISVGAGNDYGHPKQKVLDRLAKVGAKVLRTDERGTIIVTTDGESLEFAETK